MDPDLSFTSENVRVFVGNDPINGLVQLCPALLLSSQQSLPGAVKHIYSRLASAANEVDQGVPDLVLCLTSHGNQLSTRYLAELEKAVEVLIRGCGVWLLTSGTAEDPFARVVSSVLRNLLPQLEHAVEVLHVIVNNDELEARDGFPTCGVVDTSFNTLLILAREENFTSAADVAKFRASTGVKMAHPPPALLIGVPSEPMSPNSHSQQAILISPSNGKRPFPISVFAGASHEALQELLLYVENGVPSVVLQDSCELCSVLHSCSLLLETHNFSHEQFEEWLKAQLLKINLPDAEATIFKILAITQSSEVDLVKFISVRKLSEQPSMIVELCMENYSLTGEDSQVLMLAARLNSPAILSSMDIAAHLNEEILTSILCECVRKDDQLDFLTSILELMQPIHVTSNMLMQMMQSCDNHFFTTVVLCQAMGYSFVPSSVDEYFTRDVEKLTKSLSYGVDNLFPLASFTSEVTSRSNDNVIRVLAVWTMLLHRPKMVKCLAAFSDHPIAFSLALSTIARSLAKISHDWHFYENSLSALSEELSDDACTMLDTVYRRTPSKAYSLLCQPVDTFNGQNVTQLAYQSNSKALISHDCCQKWVYRKLYGSLQTKSFPIFLPKWAKIILSAIFVLPIKLWILVTPKLITREKVKSPTVELLDMTKLPKYQRAMSTYSVISSKSEALTTITAPISTNFAMNSGLGGGQDSSTPQSMIFPLNIEDVDGDSRPFSKKTAIRRATPPTITRFYSTPIVKYWISLVFRLLFIMCFSYSVLLPGCGSASWDTAMWVWAFLWWVESVFVLAIFSKTIPLHLMPWRVFDVTVFFFFLLLMLLLKVFPVHQLLDLLDINSIYPAKVVSAVFVLYVSYSTLFIYIPLSDVFGPMVVRVKIMLLRDFVNFLFMIGLIMLSSAVAIEAVVYPDRGVSVPVIREMLSWSWLSLFTTDMSALNETPQCKKQFLGPAKKFCTNVGRYADNTCPAQTVPAYLVIIEYFVILKLLLWPILFAFFAKTAKSVDDVSQKIWRFQLYTLAEDFRIRPPLPPPFTLLCVLFALCCNFKCSIWSMITSESTDHPDMDTNKQRYHTKWKYGWIYQSPSMSQKITSFPNEFWRRISIDRWKSANGTAKRIESDEISNVQEQLKIMMLSESYRTVGTELQKRGAWRKLTYPGSTIKRIHVEEEERPWTVLLPRYSPPFYCRPTEEFSIELQKYVDVASEANVAELRRGWRSRQAAEVSSGPTMNLSAAGFPLNPSGRKDLLTSIFHITHVDFSKSYEAHRAKGIAGRGNHVKFGSNRKCTYVIIQGTARDTKVLIDSTLSLPSELNFDTSSKDEHLASILKAAGLSENEAQMYAMRRLDTSTLERGEKVPISDTCPAHLSCEVADDDEDTDNAWTEIDVWATFLRDRKVLTNMIYYTWCPTNRVRGQLPAWQAELVERSMEAYSINE